MSKFSMTAFLGLDSEGLKKGLEKTKLGALLGAKGIAAAIGLATAAFAALAAAVAVAVAATAKFASASVKEFAVFEKGMAEVFTLLPDTSKKAFNSMRQDVLKLSAELGVLPEEMIPSLYNALSAGIPKENVMDFLATATKAAKAGVATTEEAVGALTTVLNGYKLPAEKAGEVSDALFTTIKNGVTTMPELAANIGKVTPIAASLGIKFDDVAAAFAEMTKAMGPNKSAETGTALKALFADLGKAGSKAADNFERISGKSFPAFIKAGGNINQALQMMAKDAELNNKRLSDLFRGVEAGNAALILAADGGKGLAGQMAEMGKKAGATDAAYKKMTGTLDFVKQQFMAMLSAGMIRAGEAFANALRAAGPALITLGKAFANLDWSRLGNAMISLGKAVAPALEELAVELGHLMQAIADTTGHADKSESVLVTMVNALTDIAKLAQIIVKTVDVLVGLLDLARDPLKKMNEDIDQMNFLGRLLFEPFDTLKGIIDEIANVSLAAMRGDLKSFLEMIRKMMFDLANVMADIPLIGDKAASGLRKAASSLSPILNASQKAMNEATDPEHIKMMEKLGFTKNNDTFTKDGRKKGNGFFGFLDGFKKQKEKLDNTVKSLEELGVSTPTMSEEAKGEILKRKHKQKEFFFDMLKLVGGPDEETHKFLRGRLNTQQKRVFDLKILEMYKKGIALNNEKFRNQMAGIMGTEAVPAVKISPTKIGKPVQGLQVRHVPTSAIARPTATISSNEMLKKMNTFYGVIFKDMQKSLRSIDRTLKGKFVNQ